MLPNTLPLIRNSKVLEIASVESTKNKDSPLSGEEILPMSSDTSLPRL